MSLDRLLNEDMTLLVPQREVYEVMHHLRGCSSCAVPFSTGQIKFVLLRTKSTA